jgi:hypothetical protein
MDEFDYTDQDRPARNIAAIVWNALTVVALIAAVCLGGLFLSIFLNPTSSLNLFPPPTLPPALALPTATPTPRGVLPPTWTPQPTTPPTETPVPLPTDTPTLQPTETPFALFTPAGTQPGEATPGGLPYALATGSPVALSSVAFHPDKGCDWMGVAGQVVDPDGAPVSTGIIIRLGGRLAGSTLDVTSLTGVAPQYGPSGFEIVLAEKPAASKASLWVQLLDQAGEPLSERVYFDTFAECEKNLIFINFKQVR